MEDKKPSTPAQKKQLKIIEKFSKKLESAGCQYIICAHIQGMTILSLCGDKESTHELLRNATGTICKKLGLPGMTTEETEKLVGSLKETIFKSEKPEANA